MKKVIFILLAFAFVARSIAQETPAETAQQIIDKAVIKANKEHKQVFVLFNASWCTWCHLLDSAMNDPACKKLFDDRYEIRHIAIQQANATPQGIELFNKYKGTALPFYVIFNGAGELQTTGLFPNGMVIGYPSEPAGWELFSAMLRKTSNLTDDQLAIIKTVIDNKKSKMVHK